MSSEPATVIELQGISKQYRSYSRPRDRLLELLWPGQPRGHCHQALQDISLRVQAGTTLGIVGRNGAGKSTLLQIIAGTVQPSQGQRRVEGRVAALLELGSGFNPDFTGRENVFFNGQLLGYRRRQLQQLLPDILEFAGIGEFIDQPVRTYSSGMMVRLAFAVLAQLEPQVLIVDEALAVGDARFQARCLQRIRQLRSQGTTILFVTHDANSVRMLCDEAVLLDGGRLIDQGSPNWVLNRYNQLLGMGELGEEAEQRERPAAGLQFDGDHPSGDRHGDGPAQVQRAWLEGAAVTADGKVEAGQPLRLCLGVASDHTLEDLVVGLSIRNLYGVVVYGSNSLLIHGTPLTQLAGDPCTYRFDWINRLNPGVYTITLGLHSEDGRTYDWIDEALVFEVISERRADGIVALDADFATVPQGG